MGVAKIAMEIQAQVVLHASLHTSCSRVNRLALLMMHALMATGKTQTKTAGLAILTAPVATLKISTHAQLAILASLRLTSVLAA